jgi:type I restriction enzyme S subunit
MFQDQKKKIAFGTKVIEVSPQKLGKVKIPIPPIEEQNRIVAILDKFDVLVNDISEGLPAEIKMRRQQYEYYRNKLLTFKEYE